MPGYRGHFWGVFLAFCILAVLLAIRSIPLVRIATCFLALFAGTLLPDIDISSKGRKLYASLALCLLVASLLISMHLAILVTLGIIFILLIPHRGITHNIWFLALLVCLFSWYAALFFPYYKRIIYLHALFFFIGAFVHLWLDFGLRRMWRMRS